jgi:hypothetical protein
MAEFKQFRTRCSLIPTDYVSIVHDGPARIALQVHASGVDSEVICIPNATAKRFAEHILKCCDISEDIAPDPRSAWDEI